MGYYVSICSYLIITKCEQNFHVFISYLCFFFYELPFNQELSVSKKALPHFYIKIPEKPKAKL